MNRSAIAAALAVAGLLAWWSSRPAPVPAPEPTPGLIIQWVGPTADADRATMGGQIGRAHV